MENKNIANKYKIINSQNVKLEIENQNDKIAI